ncbi:MAG: hypothetical protein ACK6D1_10575 [Planctomycetota bacterium]
MGRGASHDGDAAGIELERATEADRARHDLLDRHDLARQHDAAGCGHGDHVGRDRQVVLRHPDEVRAIEREFDAARAARRRGQRLDRREPALLAEADLRVGAAHALRDVDVPVAQADEIAAGAKQFGRPTTAGSAQLRSVRTPAGGSKASNARSAAASASSMRRSNSAANCQPASPCSARLFPSSAPPTRVATAAAWLSFDSSARASSATCTPSSSADAFGSSRPIVRMSLKPITGAFSNDEIHAPPACGTGDGVRSTRQARADFWPSSVVHSCRPSLPRSARNTTPASPKRPSTRWQVPTSVLVGIRLTYPGRAPG